MTNSPSRERDPSEEKLTSDIASRRWWPKRTRVVHAAALAVLAWATSGVLASFALSHRLAAPIPEPPPAGFRGVRLRSEDGVSFGAWVARARDARGSIVLVHGNGSSRSALTGDARRLLAAGFTVLPITVRAHGDSDGTTNDLGFGARHDVVAAVGFVRDLEPGRPVVVLGKSLGAAAAIFAAPTLGRRVQGYVLVAPYADLALAVRRRTERYLPPILDRVAYAALLLGARFTLPELERIRPERSARSMPRDVPVLFVTGGADRRAPTSDAHRIGRALRNARYLEVPALDHDSLVLLGSDPRYLARLSAFLDTVAP